MSLDLSREPGRSCGCVWMCRPKINGWTRKQYSKLGVKHFSNQMNMRSEANARGYGCTPVLSMARSANGFQCSSSSIVACDLVKFCMDWIFRAIHSRILFEKVASFNRDYYADTKYSKELRHSEMVSTLFDKWPRQWLIVSLGWRLGFAVLNVVNAVFAGRPRIRRELEILTKRWRKYIK